MPMIRARPVRFLLLRFVELGLDELVLGLRGQPGLDLGGRHPARV